MIQATELRIGNYAKEYDYDYEYMVVDGDTIQGIDNETRIIFPIILTEEWLLKFGFTEYECGFHKTLYIDFGISVLLKDGDIKVCLNTEDRSLLPIKHVHQLQNLYHSLTQKELQLIK